MLHLFCWCIEEQVSPLLQLILSADQSVWHLAPASLWLQASHIIIIILSHSLACLPAISYFFSHSRTMWVWHIFHPGLFAPTRPQTFTDSFLCCCINTILAVHHRNQLSEDCYMAWNFKLRQSRRVVFLWLVCYCSASALSTLSIRRTPRFWLHYHVHAHVLLCTQTLEAKGCEAVQV